MAVDQQPADQRRLVQLVPRACQSGEKLTTLSMASWKVRMSRYKTLVSWVEEFVDERDLGRAAGE